MTIFSVLGNRRPGMSTPTSAHPHENTDASAVKTTTTTPRASRTELSFTNHTTATAAFVVDASKSPHLSTSQDLSRLQSFVRSLVGFFRVVVVTVV